VYKPSGAYQAVVSNDDNDWLGTVTLVVWPNYVEVMRWFFASQDAEPVVWDEVQRYADQVAAPGGKNLYASIPRSLRGTETEAQLVRAGFKECYEIYGVLTFQRSPHANRG
jgi:hypothetical protein